MDFVDYFFYEFFFAPDKSLEAGTGAPLHVRAVRPHCARQVGLQRWPHPYTWLAAWCPCREIQRGRLQRGDDADSSQTLPVGDDGRVHLAVDVRPLLLKQGEGLG